MQKRQSHNKSRKGCQNCKKRHIKCDEQGPPCANCLARKTACVYRSSSHSGANYSQTTSLTRRPKDASTIDRLEELYSPSSGASVHSRSSKTASPVTSLTPTAFPSTLESHRLLELELMHRWSTRTWMCLCSIPEDQEYLQTSLPRAALRDSYLMNGILAIAAADLARTSRGSNTASYLRAALEYGNKASSDFRIQLCDIRPGNIDLLYYFAIIATIYNLAVPFEQLSMMDRTNLLFDMMLGATNVAMANIEWLFANHPSFGLMLSYGTASMDFLDLDTKIALDRLTSVGCQSRIFAANKETQDAGEEDRLNSEVDIYRKAVEQLKVSFAEDARGLIKGYCISMISVAGPHFALAVRKLEPMALFIVMHFGVLLDRTAKDPSAWWAGSMGKEIVKETSKILQHSPISWAPDGREGISWARRQVCLPALV